MQVGAPSDALDATERQLERPKGWGDVPWRTIIATVGVVSVTLLSAWLLYLTSRIVIWMFIAAFFAIVLAPPVRGLERRLHFRRSLAVLVVIGATLAVLGGIATLFVMPVRSQLTQLVTDLPGTIEDAARGAGPFGRIVERTGLENLVRDNEDSLQRAGRRLQASSWSVVSTLVAFLFATVTVIVTTALMLMQAPNMAATATRLVPERHRAKVSATARDAAKAVSGYMLGNLLISLCAGVSAFIVLRVLSVPNAIVLALWVAFADLMPLVGATIGAAVAVLAAFAVSPTAGVVSAVFFVVYQQFENNVLQLAVMSRTVQINPLVVLLSVLIGVELFGIAGALLAVPAAGALQVVAKEIWVQQREQAVRRRRRWSGRTRAQPQA